MFYISYMVKKQIKTNTMNLLTACNRCWNLNIDQQESHPRPAIKSS